jgi:hypothetical protein
MSDTAPEMVTKELMTTRIAQKQAQTDGVQAKLDAANTKLEGFENQPDALKMQRRLERAEAALETTQGEFDTYRKESTSTAALLTAGITDADAMAFVRREFAAAGGDDFEKWLAHDAPKNQFLMATVFATTTTQQTETNQETGEQTQQQQTPQRPATNSGVIQTTVGGGGLTFDAYQAKPEAWKRDPANDAAIRTVLGMVPPRPKPTA